MSHPIVIDPTKPLLREEEVARLLNLEIATLRRWRWAGRGPRFVKLGSAVRYRFDDLNEFIEQGARQSTVAYPAAR